MLPVPGHPKHLEPVRAVWPRPTLQECPQRRGILRVNSLVTVQEDQPLRVQIPRGIHQPLAVRRVIPPLVALAPRIPKHRANQRM